MNGESRLFGKPFVGVYLPGSRRVKDGEIAPSLVSGQLRSERCEGAGG